jgi:cytoskeletal protein CcmA (bactofilin family)
MKKILLMLLLLCLFSVAAAASAFAFGAVSADTYVLNKGETYSGDLAVSANRTVIEGTVDGDLYVFTEDLQVLGEVKGDVITFSTNTNISGSVQGNVRSFTQRLTISGSVGRNITTASQHVLLSDQAEVLGSMLSFAAHQDIFGKVGRDVNGIIKNLRITGSVGQGTSKLSVGHLQVDSSAVIQGDLVYSSHEKATVAPGAQITGKEIFTPSKPEGKRHFFVFPVIMLLMSMLSTLILWLLIRCLFPIALFRLHEQLNEGIVSHLGMGALLLFATPILALILLFTVVGIPVAVVLGLTIVILTYVAKIFIGSWAGSKLTKRFGWRLHPLIAELIGVLGLLLLTNIPLIGWLIAIAVWILFLGAIASTIRRTHKTFSLS